MVMGDLDGATRHSVAALPPAERLRHRFYLSRALTMNVWLCQLKGDWQAARDFSDRGLAVSPQDPPLLTARAVLEYQVGDFTQGQIRLEQLLEVMQLTVPGPTLDYALPAMVIPIVAYITGVASQFDMVEAETVLSSPVVTPLVAKFVRTGRALMTVVRGDAAAAGTEYNFLEPAGFPTVFGIEDNRLLGLLAHTMGNLDQAIPHFEDSLTFCREAGYLPVLAWTCCDYADTLLQQNQPGDREKAMSLLDESLAISSELGMRPLMERVLSRREILKA